MKNYNELSSEEKKKYGFVKLPPTALVKIKSASKKIKKNKAKQQ